MDYSILTNTTEMFLYLALGHIECIGPSTQVADEIFDLTHSNCHSYPISRMTVLESCTDLGNNEAFSALRAPAGSLFRTNTLSCLPGGDQLWYHDAWFTPSDLGCVTVSLCNIWLCTLRRLSNSNCWRQIQECHDNRQSWCMISCRSLTILFCSTRPRSAIMNLNNKPKAMTSDGILYRDVAQFV